MKKYTLVLGVLFAVSLSASVVLAQEPQQVGVNFHTSYIPDGFDSNDNTQLVLEGSFKNSCYRPSQPKVKVDKSKKRITVEGRAYIYPGNCLDMVVPYHQVVDLGILGAGAYEVIQPTSEKNYELGDLKIRKRSTTSPDDYLYAPVSQAYFTYNDNDQPIIRITGVFTNACMKIKDIRVKVVRDVISVLPIAELKGGNLCGSGRYRFSKSIEIDDVDPGRYLLHVRSLNAQAINTLIDIEE